MLSKTARHALMVVEIVVFAALAAWISKVCLAEFVARSPTAKNLQVAVRLNPASSDYQLQLGQLYQYSVADIDPSRAITHLRRATELNAYDPQNWLALGTALEFQGNTAAAEASMRKADFLAPHLASFQWVIGNFFLLHGNLDESFRHFRVVLAGSHQYDQTLFDTAWKASGGDAGKILDQLIPNNAETELSYLSYLSLRQRFLEAQSVWARLANSPDRFPPTYSAAYIDSLLSARRPSEAYKVWSDLRRRGLIKATLIENTNNLIINGDFEDDFLNMGFDWRIAPVGGVYAGLDRTTYHSPSHSLLIQFSGKQNIDYRQVWEYVRLAPGRSYHLEGFAKTVDITTDSGPRLEVRDAYDPASLEKFSESLTGSTTGWSSLSLDFSTGPKTELVVVGIARLPSRKLDNLIAGKVWIDDLTLTAVPQELATRINR